MFNLSKATGAKVVNNLDDLDANDLGSAELVEERKIETDKWVRKKRPFTVDDQIESLLLYIHYSPCCAIASLQMPMVAYNLLE
jgi:hypothetical protein